MRGVMMVLISPTEGHEDEFNEWYTNHVREALEIDSFVSATRFEFTDVELVPGTRSENFRYLTLYELEFSGEEGFEKAAEGVRQKFFGGAHTHHSQIAEVYTAPRPTSAIGPANVYLLRTLTTEGAQRK